VDLIAQDRKFKEARRLGRSPLGSYSLGIVRYGVTKTTWPKPRGCVEKPRGCVEMISAPAKKKSISRFCFPNFYFRQPKGFVDLSIR
jgi:hypothetical protein